MMVVAWAGDESLVGVMISWTKDISFEHSNFLCDAFESVGAVFLCCARGCAHVLAIVDEGEDSIGLEIGWAIAIVVAIGRKSFALVPSIVWTMAMCNPVNSIGRVLHGEIPPVKEQKGVLMIEYVFLRKSLVLHIDKGVRNLDPILSRIDENCAPWSSMSGS